MAARMSLEEHLDLLAGIRQRPMDESSLEQLKKAVSAKNNLIIAKAADIVAEFQLRQFVPDMETAYERLFDKPTKNDKGCTAKTAIVRALVDLEVNAPAVFLQGIRWVQLEPVWGGQADTATEMRGHSAIGLVQCDYPNVMTELAHLLADKESPARGAAAQAIALEAGPAGAPLLRFKILSGDEQPHVIGECFRALLELSLDASLPFVEGFLHDDDGQIAEAAAVALGESKSQQGFDYLVQWWERQLDRTLRRTALLAIAISRRDKAIDFLVNLVKEESAMSATDAIEALVMYKHDETLMGRISDAVAQRDESTVAKAFDEAINA